jgi:mannose-6-phosphate isomerase
MEFEERPWGTYQVLYDGEDAKVKKIIVKPGQSPSYQYHHKRAECWIITEGSGQVKIDGRISDVSTGNIVAVPALSKHTIINTHDTDDLSFIEIQTGTYFGEDDIVRLEDKYGRA